MLLLGLRLALLAIAAFCPRTLAQPGGGAAEVLASLDPAACPVAVSFETNLGQQGNKTTDVPIFVGSITIQSSDENNVSVEYGGVFGEPLAAGRSAGIATALRAPLRGRARRRPGGQGLAVGSRVCAASVPSQPSA